MSERLYQIWILIFFCLLTLTRILSATYLPPIQDEAYYFYWSGFLDLGYFDHPPLVAFMSALLNVWPGQALAARAGALVLSILALPVLLQLFRQFGLQERQARISALILASANLGGILQGYITTPDIPLIFCWMAALHEAAVALRTQPKRWLSAGFFTGLGILGKYTMVLIGPVFLIALMYHPRQLRQKWPYLGALICVITLLPHIYWLSQNDWITLRFQFGRGFKSEYGVSMVVGSKLPSAQHAPQDSQEVQLANYFILPEDEIIPPKPKPQGWRKYLQSAGDYLGGQLAYWGFLLIPLVYAFWKQRRRKHSMQAEWPSSSIKALAWSAALLPILIFGVLSPFQHIELNWPAMYLVGAAVVLSHHTSLKPRTLLIAALANMLLISLLTIHTHFPLQNSRPHRDRLLRETHGYKELAQYLAGLPDPVFTDTYQNLSQIAFYQPQLHLQQWPGIARSSELIRRVAMNPLDWTQLLQKSAAFYLLTDNRVPPRIPNATIVELTEILDCFDAGLKLTLADRQHPYRRACQKRIHRWSLARYRPL